MVKVQPVSTPPRISAESVKQSADDVEVPAEQIDLGKGQVFRADHDRDEEVSDGCRDRRHQEEEDHDDAVHGEHLVVGVRGHQVGLRRQQLKADETGHGAADEEEEGNRDEIEDRDALVVAGKQPALQPILIVQIRPLGETRRLLRRKLDDCRCAHCFTTPGPAAAGAVVWTWLVFSVCWTR